MTMPFHIIFRSILDRVCIKKNYSSKNFCSKEKLKKNFESKNSREKYIKFKKILFYRLQKVAKYTKNNILVKYMNKKKWHIKIKGLFSY